ncbi:hypothetical protein FB645_002381 [Coemansia sp. IMI 203386]|nr:hypothetical protein FB645_002381 [Coemansia sp. IMI 203386]
MHLSKLLLGSLSLAAGIFATAIPNGDKLASINTNHNSMQYSLALLQQMNDHLSSSSKEHNLFNAENMQLKRFGLTTYGPAATVKDLYNHLNVRLSDKYQYALQPIPNSLPGTAATTADNLSIKGNMLMMPFSDIFTLDPSGIRYVADLLGIFSSMNPRNAKILAPSFGISSKSLNTPEATRSVARLLTAISNMDPKSLKLASNSNVASSNDPLVTKGSLFTLSNILAISPGHLDTVTGLFESLSQMKASEMKVFLQNIGWQSSDADTSLGKQSDSLDAIPDLSYIFPLNEGTLSEMSQVAKLSTRSITAGVEQMAESLRSDVSFYLKEARDFWKALPDYFNIASLLSLVNDPYISDIIRFLTFVYNNPSASFWELLLQYYKSIGMPGLQSIIELPSQYAGSLVSSVVGGYVSDIITNIVSNILELKPTPSTSSTPSSALGTATTAVSSAVTSAPANSPMPTSTKTAPSAFADTGTSTSKPKATPSASSSALSSASQPMTTAPVSSSLLPSSSSSSTALPTTPLLATSQSASTTAPMPSSSRSLASSSSSSSSSALPQAAATSTPQITANPSGSGTAPMTSGSTSSSSSSTYDFWGFLSYFSPGKPNVPMNPEMPAPTIVSTSKTILGTVMIPH